MPGIIGKKIGMTSVYGAEGENIACTVIQAGPCVVTQVKNPETDGYRAVQLSYGDKKEKHSNKPEVGHFKKAGTVPKRSVVEFRDFRQEFEGKVELGKEIFAQDVFVVGDYVDAVGISKGRGFPKGKRLAGRMGNDRVKITNLRVVKILPEQNVIVVSGSVPGAKNSTIILVK